ncbi:MAG: hypothetical protein MMC23_003177 [Stictis urceolatum]|nr:hypothetical protein [Stictis urceolata]
MTSRLIQAARTITTTGAVKSEPSPRRIRVLLNGQYILDCTQTHLVWEHPYFPQYYFPSSALQHITRSAPLSSSDPSKFSIHDLESSNHPTAKTAIADILTGEFKGYSRFEMNLMGAWFEEDEPMAVQGHPFDPYKRIDTRKSSRRLRVEIDGVEVADAGWAVHLFETGLPVRYYLPRTGVKWEHLKESGTRSYCPYKGWTSGYWDVVLPEGKGGRDLLWGYEATPVAVGEIQGLVCFYNEKVDVWLDGQKQERPKSKFA